MTLPTYNLSELELLAYEQALEETGGNRREAAELLGTTERTMYRYINAHPDNEKLRASCQTKHRPQYIYVVDIEGGDSEVFDTKRKAEQYAERMDRKYRIIEKRVQ